MPRITLFFRCLFVRYPDTRLPRAQDPRPPSSRLSFACLSLLVLALWLGGCSETPQAPEARLPTLIAEAEQAAENRDGRALRG